MNSRRGMGLGRGFRRGFGPGYVSDDAPYPSDTQAGAPQIRATDMPAEIDRLQAQAESMQRSLEAITQRLAEMEKDK